MASINNVVTISLQETGQLLAPDNMNQVMIITNQLGVLSSSNRFKLYNDALSVESDFGSDSDVTQHANAFFAQSPNPINAGGILVVGFWRSSDETVPASAAVLTGAQLDEVVTVAAMQQISDGSMDITIDGVAKNLTTLDFQSVLTLNDIAAVINAALTGGVVSVVDRKMIITSDTTGVTSTITFATDPGTGTFIGNILSWADGTGAVLTQGADASVLSAESKVDAVTALKAQINFKGFVFINEPTDMEAESLAAWAQANDTLSFDVFEEASNLNVDPTNPVWAIKLANYTNYRCLFRLDSDRRFATEYMSRGHTVNFNAVNSAITMQLKELIGLVGEDFTQTQINAAKNVGLDIYTIFDKQVSKILTSGANDFFDNRYNILGFITELQTAVFNLLAATTTKIPQTIQGVNTIVHECEKVSERFVTAGVFAPGEWTLPETFGDLETFKTNIRTNGYYWLAQRLSDQSPVDRQDRKSPLVQGALKLSGAIHSVDILVFINK